MAVLGAGSWGTVLAALLVDAGHHTALWARRPEVAEALRRDRENPAYVPGLRLPAELEVTSDSRAATRGADLVVVAVPSATVRESVAGAEIAPGTIVACASKGLEAGTRATLDRVIEEAAPGARVALLSGPSFALEVARGLPTAVVAAARDLRVAELVQGAFSQERFRIYSSDDVVGVAVGGALKNVIAIAAGCSDGLGFGNNARAALVTRGLHELGRLAVRMGGNPLTLSGLAGLGDLVLTCTGELSRNRQVGLALARGESLPDIVARLGHVAEGVGTARIARDLARALGVEMPITDQLAAVLHEGKPAREGVAELLAREVKPERG